ncbi:MAG: hypothetical protein ACM31C_02805 [Acidobacteriota bacterium]
MKPSHTLFALLAATAACATSEKGMGPGEGSGSGSGSGSGNVPLTATGTYALHSTYDISTNMPGTAGTVINAFIDATDSPDDPTRYILDKMIGALPNGTFKSVLQGAEPFVAGYLNDRLLQVAPDFVTNIVDFGDKFGQMAKKFGTLDTLVISANGTAVHTVTGVHFVVDTEELDFAFKDYALKDVAVPGVQVMLDQTGKLTIAAHKVPLSYGAMLHLGIDNVIIPMVDPAAVTLSDVLHDWVDCAAVGEYVYEAVGIGSPSTFESACDSGLTAAGAEIYHLVDNIDGSALEFDETGTAKAIDMTGDKNADTLAGGKWTGNLVYAGTPAPLATATFTGTKQ